MDNVKKKLDEIANCISRYEADPDAGLYTGSTGMLMFMAYYSRHSECPKHNDTKNRLLDACCEKICAGSYYSPFCGGLSGALYGLHHLNKFGFIDVDLTEVHAGYSKFLSSAVSGFSKNLDFDFMHGATGIALYLLKCGEKADLECVSEYIKALDSAAEKDNGIKWLSAVSYEVGRTYNIALSHGMSSVAIFLANCVERDVESELSKNLLVGVIDYIMQQEIDPAKYGSYFPPFNAIESNGGGPRKSRMAWCYGDLGVAMALWHAGVILNNQVWQNKAREVILYASDRRELEANMVMDAGICHGTAGIAQIFRRMYYNMRDDRLLSASEYWIDETLKMAKWSDNSLAGYKYWEGTEKGWISSYNLLEGISGIGLALLASLENETLSTWDEILLCS